LMGGSYRFTDATGTWTSKTTFGVLDLASWRVVPVELEGQYGYEAMSNDGQILYLAEYTSTSTRSRAYDLKTRGLGDVIGDATFQIRRSAPMNDTVNRGLPDGVLAFVHPTADAKMGFGTGAILSPDGASIYVLAAQGVWKVDRGALKAKVLTHDGAYETVAVSPDGARLYVLGRMDGVISAIDAQSG